MSSDAAATPVLEDASITDAARAVGVEVDRVSKRFDSGSRSVQALADVSLEIAAGEFVALVGTSGCGKSTLLRMLAGLLPPSGGAIRVGGVEVEAPRPDVAMMLQTPTLLPWRTVMGNVLLPVEVQRKPTAADRERARELVALVDLEAFADYYPGELSGGMQQRVALARVLIMRPALLLLDEPFGALDDFTRENLNCELADLAAQQGASVVLVTHNIGEAIFLADRVVTLGGSPGVVQGEIRTTGARPRPLEVMRSPEFQSTVERVRATLGLS